MSIRAYSVGRNGMPERVNYVYRGTGEDTLTGHLGDYALEPYRTGYEQWVPDLGPSSGRVPVQPCGTPAAYKRHLRHGEDPCEDCKLAEARDFHDRTDREALNARRRERYDAATAAGASPREARQMSGRGAA